MVIVEQVLERCLRRTPDAFGLIACRYFDLIPVRFDKRVAVPKAHAEVGYFSIFTEADIEGAVWGNQLKILGESEAQVVD